MVLKSVYGSLISGGTWFWRVLILVLETMPSLSEAVIVVWFTADIFICKDIAAAKAETSSGRLVLMFILQISLLSLGLHLQLFL